MKWPPNKTQNKETINHLVKLNFMFDINSTDTGNQLEYWGKMTIYTWLEDIKTKVSGMQLRGSPFLKNESPSGKITSFIKLEHEGKWGTFDSVKMAWHMLVVDMWNEELIDLALLNICLRKREYRQACNVAFVGKSFQNMKLVITC